MLMTLAGNMLALVSAIGGSDRAFRVAVSNDQTLNAALAGSEDETISSRAGKAARAGKRWGASCANCSTPSTPSTARKTSKRMKGKG